MIPGLPGPAEPALPAPAAWPSPAALLAPLLSLFVLPTSPHSPPTMGPSYMLTPLLGKPKSHTPLAGWLFLIV